MSRPALLAPIVVAAAFAVAPAGAHAAATRFVGLFPPGTGGGSCVAPHYNLIQAAVDASRPGDTIHICPGTHRLTAPIVVPIDVIFEGDGAASIVDGASGSRRVRLIDAAGRLVGLRSLTLQNGAVDGTGTTIGGGGAVRARTVTAEDCTFLGNTVTNVSDGGGAIAADTISVTRSTFQGNEGVRTSGTSTMLGGGAIFGTTSIAVTDSVFVSNRASGSFVDGGAVHGLGSAIVTGSTFVTNDGGGSGGALHATTAVVATSTFRDNTVPRGGGVVTDEQDGGGAIDAIDLRVDASTFAGNLAGVGGALRGESITVVNSTFAENDATVLGGAIQAIGDVAIANATFKDNTAAFGGQVLYHGTRTSSPIPGSTVRLANDIFAGPATGDTIRASIGSLIDGGGNLSVDGSPRFTNPTSRDSVSTAFLALGPLADNGGPTDTIALRTGSVAIGAGSCILATDQRGFSRPAGPRCDSGAFEHDGSALTTSTTSTTTTTTTTNGSNTSTTVASTTTTFAGSSTTTSTPVGSSTSTTTPPPVTSCAVATTFSSLRCRTDALRARVLAASELGAFQPKLATRLEQAVASGDLARSSCSERRHGQAKARLRRATNAVARYVRKLDSRKAWGTLDAAMRDDLREAGEAIVADVRLLRARLVCPGDAAR